MSIRTKFLRLVDIMMRVPPIMVIDEIFKAGMGLSNRVNSSALSLAIGIMCDSDSKIMRFLLYFLVFLAACCVFLVWARHLARVYMYIISLFITLFSCLSNMSAVKLLQQSDDCMLQDLLSFNRTRLLDTGSIAMSLAPHIMAQWLLGILFAFMHLGPRCAALRKPIPLIFISPILLAMLPLPQQIVRHAPFAAALLPLVFVIQTGTEITETLYNGYCDSIEFAADFGLNAVLEHEWQRLNVPNVMRVFWTIRVGGEFFSLARQQGLRNMEFMPTVQHLFVEGCDTSTAVLGMTAVISLICHYIGRVFHWYLLTYDHEEEQSLGTVSAVLFFVLALQTGLTSLTPEKRFVRLFRNMCLLFTALLHFLHNIVSPILMSLSASRNPSVKRHVQALSVCAFLVVASICLLTALWSQYTPSTWLLAVTASSTEIIVKVSIVQSYSKLL